MIDWKVGDRVRWLDESDDALGYVAYVIDGWVGVYWDDYDGALEEYEIAVTPEIEATCEP